MTIMRKPGNILLVAICGLGLLASAGAEEKHVILGGTAGWGRLSLSQGLTVGKGRLGHDALTLSTELPTASDQASRQDRSSIQTGSWPGANELTLSFDALPFRDEEGNYDVIESKLIPARSGKARRGAGAAICNTDGVGLTLRGRSGAMFSSRGDPGSFNIEFWIFPAVAENGSVLLQWRSGRSGRPDSAYQYLRASIVKNRLTWDFSNIWSTMSGGGLTFSLSGGKTLIPGTWSHHSLSYDGETGLVEYRLDGVAEAVRYVTSTGSDSGDVYPLALGAPADLEIAPRFSGVIDEFKIARRPARLESLEDKHAALDRYSGPGRFESLPIDTKGVSSVLSRIVVDVAEPAGTGTTFFARAADNAYQLTDEGPEWVPVESGVPLTGITGRFLQIAGELYADGAGALAPTVSTVTVFYAEDLPPWPPAKVFASGGNGCVKLEWIASIDFDAAGYLVYYGERPGEYLGAGSPIDVGKSLGCTVPGLKNGKAYYFCVAAYDAAGPDYPGQLSGEARARPLVARASQ